MRKVLLVSTPFNSMRFPPLHIASSKSYLKSQKIPVEADCFYLRCAMFIGLELYNFLRLTNTGDMFYACHLFSERKGKIKKYIEEQFKIHDTDKEFANSVDFESILQKLKKFNEEVLNSKMWEKYDLVAFYCYYQQLLPSLYLAKRIKNKYPKIQTVFGGLDCNFDLGKGILEAFPYVDFTINGEFEEPLAELYFSIQGELDITKVSALTYRKGGSIKTNSHRDQYIELDELPYPDYDDFFLGLKDWSQEMLSKYCNNFFLQVEFTRGCWWNKCSFCTLNSPYGPFREKSPESIVAEISFLIQKYKTLQILPQQFSQPKKWREILKAIKSAHPGLVGCIGMNFRIQDMSRKDYQLLKHYGVIALFGIESLSTRYLGKMKKGTTAIENIEALKLCEEYGVVSAYNILHGYPNEETEYFEENRKAIEYVLHLPPPFDIETLRLTYNSEIFRNPNKYQIKDITIRDREKLLYPQSILRFFKPFFYDFIPEKPVAHTRDEWEKIIQRWRDTYNKQILQQHLKMYPLLYFQEDKRFVNIVDSRGANCLKYTFFDKQKDIYLFCDEIRTKQDILDSFSNLQKSELESFITEMDQLKLIYIEDDKVLSLAVRLQ